MVYMFAVVWFVSIAACQGLLGDLQLFVAVRISSRGEPPILGDAFNALGSGNSLRIVGGFSLGGCVSCCS
jgi:hypothetical protein